MRRDLKVSSALYLFGWTVVVPALLVALLTPAVDFRGALIAAVSAEPAETVRISVPERERPRPLESSFAVAVAPRSPAPVSVRSAALFTSFDSAVAAGRGGASGGRPGTVVGSGPRLVASHRRSPAAEEEIGRTRRSGDRRRPLSPGDPGMFRPAAAVAPGERADLRATDPRQGEGAAPSKPEKPKPHEPKPEEPKPEKPKPKPHEPKPDKPQQPQDAPQPQGDEPKDRPKPDKPGNKPDDKPDKPGKPDNKPDQPGKG